MGTVLLIVRHLVLIAIPVLFMGVSTPGETKQMGAIFSLAIPVISEIEGKYVNNSEDYGGETKYGISKREYPHLDIKNLTRSQALHILESDFWVANNLSQINDQEVANQIFAMIVNAGAGDGIKIAQKGVNSCSFRPVLKVDGVMGIKTIQALNSIAPEWLNDCIRVEAIRFYLQRTDTDKTQISNFRGWVRRALS